MSTSRWSYPISTAPLTALSDLCFRPPDYTSVVRQLSDLNLEVTRAGHAVEASQECKDTFSALSDTLFDTIAQELADVLQVQPFTVARYPEEKTVNSTAPLFRKGTENIQFPSHGSRQLTNSRSWTLLCTVPPGPSADQNAGK